MESRCLRSLLREQHTVVVLFLLRVVTSAAATVKGISKTTRRWSVGRFGWGIADCLQTSWSTENSVGCSEESSAPLPVEMRLAYG